MAISVIEYFYYSIRSMSRQISSHCNYLLRFLIIIQFNYSSIELINQVHLRQSRKRLNSDSVFNELFQTFTIQF